MNINCSEKDCIESLKALDVPFVSINRWRKKRSGNGKTYLGVYTDVAGILNGKKKFTENIVSYWYDYCLK